MRNDNPAGAASLIARNVMVTIGLAQFNNSFAGAHYLPYTCGLLQSAIQADAALAPLTRFLPPLYRRMPVAAAVEQLRTADVAGFSLSVWNARLSLEVARCLKQVNPACLIVVGGPHLPDLAEPFLRQHPWVDLAVHGEGELTFREVVRHLPARDWPSVAGLSFIDDRQCFHVTPARARIDDLDAIPSPYLGGVFDPLLHGDEGGEWLMLWETNRGCPYQCAFCNWGSVTQSKVVRFAMARLEAELAWCATAKVRFIFCCDANFGLLPRDVEIARLAARAKARSGYPEALSVQGAKNAVERLFTLHMVLEEAGLNKGAALAMQSLDASVLEHVQRKNIPSDTFRQLQQRFTEAGVATFTDLILGLPGESYDTFTNGVDHLLASGQHNRIQFINLSVLPNSAMGDPAYRARYGLELVESRVLNSHASVEVEDAAIEERQQLVIATAALPRPDWRRARVFSFLTALLHFDKLLQIPLVLLHQAGLGYRPLIEAFLTVDGDRYPLLGGVRDRFEARAAAIQAGEPELVHAPDWLDIWWPDDEFAFITLATGRQWDPFYAEAAAVLTAVARTALGEAPAWLPDALRANQALLRLPHAGEDLLLTLDHPVLEAWQRALLGEPFSWQGEKAVYRLLRARQNWPDWTSWCREVVWWGNKRGAYLTPWERVA